MTIRSLFLALVAAAALAGCSTVRTIDSDVQAFSTLEAVPAEASYRFERLPSQQLVGALQQDQLEQTAEQALARVGLKRDDAHPKFSVQVSLGAQRQLAYDPWASPAYAPWGYGGYRRRGYYGPWGGGWGGPPFPDRVIYQHQANVLIRDLTNGKVVYETHAAYDSVQPADATVVGIMLDSALYGFPKSSQGIRRVNVDIPR